MKELRTKILNRFALIYILFLLLGIVAIIRIIKLQFFEREKWVLEEKKYTLRNIVIEPNRGNIFSDDGSLLKSSIPFYEVRFDSQVEALTDDIFNKNVDSLAYLLGKEFGKPVDYYYNKLINARRNGNRFCLLPSMLQIHN